MGVLRVLSNGSRVAGLGLLLCGVCAVSTSLSAQDNVPRAHAVRATEKIQIDGRLEELAWAEADSIGEIHQREPLPGQPPSEKTEVKILFDNQNLYIGVRCFDSQPAGIIGTRMVRDADLLDDDRIELLLDTYRDRRNAYYLATNPLGVLVDGLIIENGTLNREWDAIWQVRTQRFPEGWSAEFAIPFKTLTFPAQASTWGFNFSRTIKRKIEEDRWASPRLDVQFLQVSEAGEITYPSEITQGRGLDVRPFVAGRWLHRAQTAKDTLTGDPGLDVFYNITPNLKWTSTLNTDFGETEVDARQINLTRFPTFFPEKRSFFLENVGVFNFANTGNELIPFFSRRVSLLEDEEVPILVGSKLTGKIQSTDVGLLYARTGETIAASPKDFFVGRVKQNLFRQSYLGAIFTEGNPGLAMSARTFGADARLATSRFLGSERNFNFNTFWLESSNEGVPEDDAAFGFSASYPNDLLEIRLDWRQIGENFRPALGFAPRPGVRFLRADLVYGPRPRNFLNVRRMLHEFFFTRYTRLDHGRVESWRFQIAPLLWDFNSGDHIEFNYAPVFERLFEPDEISDGVILPPGDYSFTRWRLEAFTASKRALEVRVTWWFGTYWSGHADEIRTILNWKVAPHFQASLDANQTFARLKEGTFVARLFTLRLNYSLSPFISISNFVQYDNDSRNLGWQTRFRWILKAGNDIFMTVNQGWQQESEGGLHFRVSDRKLAAKVQYTLRF
ncbi:MAG: carbohydrate binding family 9 domain-containing protein [Acidobacteria bacterium]|nr:carbohydrate binding family 9 domain-containing protein [Acidobacteriota bacterium]